MAGFSAGVTKYPTPNRPASYPTASYGPTITPNPYTTNPSMKRDPAPVLQDVLNYGGSVSKKQTGSDLFGNPIFETSYQEADPLTKLQRAITGISGSASSSGGGSFTVPGRESMGAVPDMGVDSAIKKSQDAAFGQAKARAGALGRSAVDTLSDELAGRGILGSGTNARGIADRLAAATNPLSDLNVAQLGENAANARHNQDLAASAATTEFQGNIAQRGQDIGAAQANAALAAQKQQAMYSMLSRALGGISGGAGLSY